MNTYNPRHLPVTAGDTWAFDTLDFPSLVWSGYGDAEWDDEENQRELRELRNYHLTPGVDE